MDDTPAVLISVYGPDAPGIAHRVFERLAGLDVAVVDVEQIQVHERLLLCVEVAGAASFDVEAALAGAFLDGEHLQVQVVAFGGAAVRSVADASLVTVLAPELAAGALGAICARITRSGGNIDRIVRLATYPITSFELVVSGARSDDLRRALGEEAVRHRIDVAVQPAGLHRRAKHLIVLDVDSTLIQDEVLDLLAHRSGHGHEVAEVTAAAMAGELDFAEALHKRVSLLAGLDANALDAVRQELRLAPGARTLIRTLTRLGYETAVVSGGFIQVIADLAAELGIGHVAANELEIVDGRLTGRLVGPIVDRAGKAAALVDFAARTGVPLTQTIAVGDGANDLDMLAVAGLGIAFNAKPAVREVADTTLSVPFLDAILFLLGISRDEVEAADREADEGPGSERR